MIMNNFSIPPNDIILRELSWRCCLGFHDVLGTPHAVFPNEPCSDMKQELGQAYRCFEDAKDASFAESSTIHCDIHPIPHDWS